MVNYDGGRSDAPPPNPGAAELAIVGTETTGHTVPAEVLVRALDGLQQIVYLLAAADEGRPIGERFAKTEHFKERYALRCGVPRASSYAVPLGLDMNRLLLPGGLGATPLERALDVFRAAAHGAWGDLMRLVPDPKYSPRVLAVLQAMLPRPGDRWGVALTIGADQVTLDVKTYRAVRRQVAPDGVEDAVMTVTGDLVRVDFDKSRIVLRYAPTGQEIPCYCEEAVLGALVQDWYLPIQVTGRFTLDRGGNIRKLTHVTRVETIDLSPMTFDRVEWDGRQLAIDPPLTLKPTMDEESGQLYVLRDPALSIHVFARSREQVADELAEQMLFQWDTYAHESPDRLTPGAQWLRSSLLSRVQEVGLAPQPEGR
jgi:hypothetical protein